MKALSTLKEYDQKIDELKLLADALMNDCLIAEQQRRQVKILAAALNRIARQTGTPQAHIAETALREAVEPAS